MFGDQLEFKLAVQPMSAIQSRAYRLNEKRACNFGKILIVTTNVWVAWGQMEVVQFAILVLVGVLSECSSLVRGSLLRARAKTGVYYFIKFRHFY